MKELDERLDHEEAVDSPSSPETLSVWGLAWPSILNNILFAFVSIVALKAVGALGTEAVAAVGDRTKNFLFFTGSSHGYGNRNTCISSSSHRC